MGDTLCSLIRRGKECGGHSLSPYKKGAKSVGDTLLLLLIREQRVWGTLFYPFLYGVKECVGGGGGHSLLPYKKGSN